MCTSPRQLPTAVQLHILSLLPLNEQALSGRFVCPDASSALCSTASLSQPLPPHAASWAQEAARTLVRQLPFGRKLQLLCTAAASGSTANLDVAWAVVQPSIFPELPHSKGALHLTSFSESALQAGRPRVLGWLMQQCPGMLESEQVLRSAATHCDLAGLQAVWQMLEEGYGRGVVRQPYLTYMELSAAAGSATPDAVPKVAWVREKGGHECRLQPSIAEEAVRGGQMGTLRWLRDQGCPIEAAALACALRHLDLASVQWLVDEGLCSLPTASERPSLWGHLLETAARGPDGVAKLQWLQQRGAPPLDRGDTLLVLVRAAGRAGQVEVMQHLLAAYGPTAVLQSDPAMYGPTLAGDVAGSGCVPLAECMRRAGMDFNTVAYVDAGRQGHLPMVRWLALEAGLSAAGLPGRDLKPSWGSGPATQLLTAGTCWRRCSCWWAPGSAGGARETCSMPPHDGATWPWCSTCCSSCRSRNVSCAGESWRLRLRQTARRC